MRTASNVTTGIGVLAMLALGLGGCGKVEQKDSPDPGKSRAEAQRHRAACASSVAYGRLKGLVFDQAVRRHAGDRTNLDILADYSVVRIEEPVVAGRDPALDLTRCTGRFILQVPPGAERGFGGERSLRADIDYSAQAAADGSGYVYRLTGAEAIIARLAAFTLSAGAYRPSPAIDQGRADAGAPDDGMVDRTEMPPSSPPEDPARSAPMDAAGRPGPAAGGGGEAAVRAFYAALGRGDGRAASGWIVPEKRANRAFAPDAIARFYGGLAEPIRLLRIVPLAPGAYQVRYRYAAGRSRCQGRAIVRLADQGGRDLIRSIEALDGC